MKNTLLECIDDLEKEVSRISYLIGVTEYIRICQITDQLRDVAVKLP